ncbi:MAG: DUF983 domain-containing protein [Alphaproteobacteria bacterium]|nr:DUF983 domain-containing protein [Alphaproteobacteria bacterium]
MQDTGQEREFWVGLRRGLAGLCPCCGQARLFASYLKVVSRCTACGHELGQYKSDDGPAYFTILIVGHLLLGPLLLMEIVRTLPLELTLTVMLSGLVIVTLWLLPIVKGAFVGAQWALRDDGSGS